MNMQQDNDFTRKLPCSLPAERALLGSILIDPASLNDVISVLTGEDFYLTEHKEIFNAMRELFDISREIDPVTLIDTLVHKGVYDKAGGEDYIRSLLEATPNAMNLSDYARIIKDESLRRRIIETCAQISEQSFAQQEAVARVLDFAQGQFAEIAQGRDSRGFRSVRDVLREILENLHKLSEDKNALAGTPTGFSGVDRVLVGMGDADLVLVGARPGMGKTSFALNIATNVASGADKKTVCIFSLEMSAEQLVSRIISSEAMIESRALRSGQLTAEDWKKIADTAARLSGMNLEIDDTPGLSVSDMKAKLRHVKNLGLIVIDYLGLMSSERQSENRAVEVGYISTNLKRLAKELHVPVLCCAQLSRGPEGRTDKRPQLSDLRDSGSIEQDADVVMFLYREEYYKTDRATDNKEANVAEVIIQKNRHGSTGNIKLGWIGPYTKFISIDTEREAPDA